MESTTTTAKRIRSTWAWGLLYVISAGLLTTCTTGTFAQTNVPPAAYYTFNGSNATTDSMGLNNLNFTYYGGQYGVGTNGQVGKYVTFTQNTSVVLGGPVTFGTGMTVEFLFRPGTDFNTVRSTVCGRSDNAFVVEFEYPNISFSTYYKTNAGTDVIDRFTVNLDGIGRKSYGYYVDGNWHHMVFRADAATGSKQIWVDGQLPTGFSKNITPGVFQNSGNTQCWLNTTVGYAKYYGDLDEFAIYGSAIPAALIYKHYLGVQSGTTYSFLNNYNGTIPSPSPTTAAIDVTEFTIGHPSTTMTATEQLAGFPVPRFKPGNTLIKNVNWMDPRYMGGQAQPGATQASVAANSTTLQVELAKNFNYFFHVELNNDPIANAWNTAANSNPDFKLSTILFRGAGPAELVSQSKPANHYLQNSTGQFLDINGNVTSTKIWRPTAPVSSYVADGSYKLGQFNDLFTRLNRGVDLINENGEIFPIITPTAMAKDPDVTAAKNASGLSWADFLSLKVKENETQAYRDQFMGHPWLSNSKFTEYNIDGYTPSYFHEYSEWRKVNTMINGQYYATTSFYPRWPSNWRNWATAWHGWQWIVESRVHELAYGDRLFSPFVSPGWDANEEFNMRPAQWLGLLKCLGMAGAEFYYTGFFNLSAPWPDSKNWIWQAAMPSYAQAITSRYEDILRSGSLLDGDVPNSYTNPSGPGYSFKTGDSRKLIVARKHSSLEKYAITGTIQPNNNMTGNVEDESVAQINIGGSALKFKVRRQGSTYIYDKTNPASPVFYQLDGWHERTHPSRWNQDFYIEGELFDNANSQLTIKTSVPAGTPAGDYTNFTSYVTWPDGTPNPAAVEYTFQPRNNGNNNLYLWVRARSRQGVTTSMNVQFDNNAAKTIGCISDTAWVWYRYDACTQQPINANGLTIQQHTLRITPANANLEIDRIVLTSNANLGLSTAPPACGSATATITASGNTSFCQGSSVTLTASAGTSYLWSPGGQTTQSINVTAQGSYQVTVGNGSGCAALSNAMPVTVLPLPTTVVTVAGSTTLCPGNTAVLSAPAGAAGYLWQPGGQTTQSITVSAAGYYQVRVTGTNGCTANSNPVTVTTATAPTANVTPSGATTFCQGGSVTLTASSANGYYWMPGGQTTQSITVNATGTYSVRVTGAGGCTATSPTTTVTVNPIPTATITAGGPTTFCQGGNVSLNASTGTSYLWTPGGQTTQSINVTNAGSYTVRVTNAGGCSATSSATNIVVNALPVANITAGGPTSFCNGGDVTLTSTSGSAYLWMPGGLTTQSISASSSGSYTVRVTNGAGCSATSAATNVSVAAPVNAVITPSGSTALQPGQSVTLAAAGGVTYQWLPDGQTSTSITVNVPGTYQVIAFDASGCSGTSAPIVVTLAPVTGPPATITTSNGTNGICIGTPLTLTASTGSAYLWSPGGETTQSITITNPGTYSVNVTDISGTGITAASIDVDINPAPDPAAIITMYVPGSSYQLMAYEPTAHTYLWSTGETTQTITVNTTGTYTVTATNGLGCISPPRTMTVNAMNPNSCSNPDMLMHYGITKTEAILMWNPAIIADSFRVELTNLSTNNTQVFNTAGNVNHVNLADLDSGQTYKWVVKAICNSIYHPGANMQFTTLSGPLPCGSTPQYLKTNAVNATLAKLSWFDTQADKFVIRFRPVGTTTYEYRRIYNSLTNATILGLIPSTTYEWSVRSMCGTNYSLYSGPQYFTTLQACPSVGGVTLEELGFNKAKVGWNAAILVDTVMIRWAPVGTADYKVIKIIGNPNPGSFYILNLDPLTTYTAWVATKCIYGSTSMWGQGITFTTLSEPATRYTDEAGPIHLNAYPNPTKHQIGYVFDSDDDEPYSVKVMDMAGRELFYEERRATQGLTDGKISLPGYASGLYMLVVQKRSQVGRFKFNVHE